MNVNKIFIITFLLSVGLLGCREEVVLDNLPGSQPAIVIEGLVTDQNTVQTVRITQSTESYYAENFDTVTNAQVAIVHEDEVYDLVFNPETGLYETNDFIGETGGLYTLKVNHEGVDYESSGVIVAVPEVEELYYKYLEENTFIEAGYYIFYRGTLPENEDFHFRIKVYENDSLYDGVDDYLVFDNDLINGQVEFNTGYRFELGDTVSFEMYSLNKDIYDYYVGLLSILGNDGGLFSSPPVNPPSNIKNLTDPDSQVLGFFQVSAVAGQRIIIKEE